MTNHKKNMQLDFEKTGGLIPAIIQDSTTKNVLMLGYMNEEALQITQETGRVTFWSRTRKCLWTKGETSGHYLSVVSITPDCDNDTLLIEAVPHGPVCHTGSDTCFGGKNEADSIHFLSSLQDVVCQRHKDMPEGSYTTSLFRDGTNRMAQKVGEEALEAVIEAVSGNNDRLVYEAADLIYHLEVLLASKGLRIEDIADELRQRHQPGWKKH